MSVLCQKNLSINVAASCAFIQDVTNDSIRINGGVAYSSDRQEILAVSSNTAALYPISLPSRVGGAKVVMAALGRGVAWCPSVSKYYITLNNSTVRPYNPATQTFDAAIATPFTSDGIVYAASNDSVYCISGSERIIQINPHTAVATTVFDGGAFDDYGYDIAYASSLNAIVGRMQQAGTQDIYLWVLSLPGNTLTTFLVGSGTINVPFGVTWDSTRGRVWINTHSAANLVSFFRVVPTTGAIDQIDQIANQSQATHIRYDSASDAIYYTVFASGALSLYQLRASDATFHLFSDPGFLYETGVEVVVVSSLFYTGCFKSAGAINAIRSCAVSQFP